MGWRRWATFVALCIIWGTPYLFIKIAIAELPPVVVAWTRVALGASLLLPIAWRKGTLRPLRHHKSTIFAFAVAELVVPFVAISYAERWVSSSFAGILIATVPMVVILLAPLFGVKEKVSARRLFGLAVGFGGVVVLLGIGALEGWQQWLGAGLLLLGAVGYAAGPLVVQRYLHEVDELAAVAVSLAIATVLLLPAALYYAPLQLPSTGALLSLAMLGSVCTALAMSLYFYLIVGAGAARASVVAYINPAVAALLGVWILHEHFGWSSAAGLGLILLGSWLATHRSELPVQHSQAG